jgi:hypothetical protein
MNWPSTSFGKIREKSTEMPQLQRAIDALLGKPQ